MRQAHVTDLRAVVNAIRTAAGVAPQSWTDAPVIAGQTLVRALHVTELRTALSNALTALGIDVPSFGVVPANGVVRASHLTEIRNATK